MLVLQDGMLMSHICILYQVVAVAVNSGLVTFPVSYSVAYKTSGLTIWMPEAPEGYTALGCVANPGDDPPALTEVACIATGIGRRSAAQLRLSNSMPALHVPALHAHASQHQGASDCICSRT